MSTRCAKSFWRAVLNVELMKCSIRAASEKLLQKCGERCTYEDALHRFTSGAKRVIKVINKEQKEIGAKSTADGDRSSVAIVHNMDQTAATMRSLFETLEQFDRAVAHSATGTGQACATTGQVPQLILSCPYGLKFSQQEQGTLQEFASFERLVEVVGERNLDILAEPGWFRPKPGLLGESLDGMEGSVDGSSFDNLSYYSTYEQPKLLETRGGSSSSTATSDRVAVLPSIGTGLKPFNRDSSTVNTAHGTANAINGHAQSPVQTVETVSQERTHKLMRVLALVNNVNNARDNAALGSIMGQKNQANNDHLIENLLKEIEAEDLNWPKTSSDVRLDEGPRSYEGVQCGEQREREASIKALEDASKNPEKAVSPGRAVTNDIIKREAMGGLEGNAIGDARDAVDCGGGGGGERARPGGGSCLENADGKSGKTSITNTDSSEPAAAAAAGKSSSSTNDTSDSASAQAKNLETVSANARDIASDAVAAGGMGLPHVPPEKLAEQPQQREEELAERLPTQLLAPLDWELVDPTERSGVTPQKRRYPTERPGSGTLGVNRLLEQFLNSQGVKTMLGMEPKSEPLDETCEELECWHSVACERVLVSEEQQLEALVFDEIFVGKNKAMLAGPPEDVVWKRNPSAFSEHWIMPRMLGLSTCEKRKQKAFLQREKRRGVLQSAASVILPRIMIAHPRELFVHARQILGILRRNELKSELLFLCNHIFRDTTVSKRAYYLSADDAVLLTTCTIDIREVVARDPNILLSHKNIGPISLYFRGAKTRS